MAVLTDFGWWTLEMLSLLFHVIAFVGEICVYTVLHVYRAVAYIAGLAHFVWTVLIIPVLWGLYSIWVYFRETELIVRNLISVVACFVIELSYRLATEAILMVWWLVSCVVLPVITSSIRITFSFIIVPLVQVTADAVTIMFDLLEMGIYNSIAVYGRSYSLYTSNYRHVLLGHDALVRVLMIVVKVALVLFVVCLVLSVPFRYREALLKCYQILCGTIRYGRHTAVALMQYFQQYAVGQFRWEQHADNGHRNPNDGDAHNVNDAIHLLCIICVERSKCVVLRPCNHLCLCEECEPRLLHRVCPICRRQVVGTMRVYVT